jgi:gamma-glutamylcyclotransferase (GGCT)/AIG2-like uncharacterized protein YtfP
MMPQHLFVYGTLRPQLARGEAQALIAALKIVGSATVQGKLYDFGSYPGVTNEKGLVFGDLLLLSSAEQLRLLDAYEECNGSSPLFTRSITTARISAGTSIAAWIYLFCGRAEPGVLIASGDYQQYMRSRLSH